MTRLMVGGGVILNKMYGKRGVTSGLIRNIIMNIIIRGLMLILVTMRPVTVDKKIIFKLCIMNGGLTIIMIMNMTIPGLIVTHSGRWRFKSW